MGLLMINGKLRRQLQEPLVEHPKLALMKTGALDWLSSSLRILRMALV